MWGSLALMTLVVALSGCASPKPEYAINIGIDRSMATAAVSNYRGADAQAQLDNLASGYCRANTGDGHTAGQMRVLIRYDSDDRRSHSLEFECEAAAP